MHILTGREVSVSGRSIKAGEAPGLVLGVPVFAAVGRCTAAPGPEWPRVHCSLVLRICDL